VPHSAWIARRIDWMRGAFCSGQVTPAIAAWTSAVGAAATAAQSGKRCRSALKAAPLSALRVRCGATAGS